jgi:hypothetical protein
VARAAAAKAEAEGGGGTEAGDEALAGEAAAAAAAEVDALEAAAVAASTRDAFRIFAARYGQRRPGVSLGTEEEIELDVSSRLPSAVDRACSINTRRALRVKPAFVTTL